jgi:hypothetical protein
MTPDPKPTLGPAGIRANISYYESRVHSAHNCWEQELQSLQYWMDQLELTKHQEENNDTDRTQ